MNTPGKFIINRIKRKGWSFQKFSYGKNELIFSGRSVITPDSTIDVDQLGVPYEIAKTLTVPEKVTPNNISELRQRIIKRPQIILSVPNL